MRKQLKKLYVAFFAVLLSAGAANAQMFLLEDVNGRPIRKTQYEDINGSPYLYDNWMKGSVVLGNGNLYENVPLRYDQVADQLLFQTPEGQELEFVQPVREFQIDGSPVVYRSGFAPIDQHSSSSFYQVLEDGKVKLLKKSHKVIREEKAYGTATISKNVLEYTNYYITQGSQLVKVKNEKNLLQLLPGHTQELEGYIKKNKLKLKEDAEMAQLVAYYNSL
ncbi:hypothetical protein [Pontibacter anaerobius]|uniref:Uncharacterized protein n=1 Tax=Pontibacter anaerobius TaxID=2993940 RepID=A0ABT3RAK6_9BACT|nr:hypothetical protein [Pontibacter anaerobius]MCX2738418.1 hypothetical protein [Pontibacter anaerobius]